MRNWVYNAQFEDSWSQLGNIDSFNLGMQQGKHPEEVTKNDVLSFILDSNLGRKIKSWEIKEV